MPIHLILKDNEELADRLAKAMNCEETLINQKIAINKVLEALQIFNTVDASQYLGISSSTLKSWRREGRGAKYFQYGKKIMYHRKDLDAFYESCKVETSDSKPK